jgi:hypothetical protein
LMCRAWNSPGYQELERLLPLLRADSPAAYKAVVAMFVYPSFRRRAVCPRCRPVGPPHAIGVLHKHGRRSVVLVPRMVRTPLYPVEPEQVEAAVDWLEGNWRGEPFVPEELLPLVAAA